MTPPSHCFAQKYRSGAALLALGSACFVGGPARAADANSVAPAAPDPRSWLRVGGIPVEV